MISYGWWIVTAALFLGIYNAAFFGHNWTAFISPIIVTFGWTMAQISLASSLRSVESGVFSPVWGFVVDRYSPRKLMLGSVIITGVGIFILSQSKNIGMFYSGFLLMGLGTSLTHILPTVLLSRWFKRDFGKANGVLAMSPGIGGVLATLIVLMIDSLGWQISLLYCAIGWMATGIPLAMVYRNPSSDVNLSNQVPVREKEKHSNKAGVYIKAVFKMRAFWHINTVAFVQIFITTVPMIYLMPYLESVGISRTTSSIVITLYDVASLCGRIPFGWLADKYQTKYLLAINSALIGIGLFIFSRINAQSPFVLIILFAIAYGLGLSGVVPLRAPILREYFGTNNFGTILGVSSIFTTVAQLLAPIVVGLFVTKYGNYGSIWLGLGASTVLGVIAMLTIPRSKGESVTSEVNQA